MQVTRAAAGTKLKRRWIRQLEQRFGPAWRYVADWAVKPTPGGTVGSLDVPLSSLGELSLGELNRVGHSKCSGGTRSETKSTSHGKDRVVVSQSTLFSSSPSSRLGRQLEGDPSCDDPVLEFLAHDDEDSVLLLAMWTSLHRCCVHASELSEGLSFKVRWFLHHLIHVRATAVAVCFYHRLLSLGVHLQQWDVSLLLRSLPYEHYAADVDFESEVKRRRRHRHVVRRNAASVTEKRGDEVNSSYSNPCFDGSRKEFTDGPGETHLGAVRMPTIAGSSHDSVPCLGVTGRLCGGGLQNCEWVSVGGQYLQDQPEWVKRWILYEASMGNVDLCGDANVPVSSVLGSVGLPPAGLEESDDCMFAESKLAERCINVTNLLNHLMLLHEGSHLVAHGNSAEKLSCKGSPGVTVRRNVRRRYWAEALQIARVFFDSHNSREIQEGGKGELHKKCLNISPEFRSVLCRAFLATEDWKVSLRCLRASELYKVNFTHEEYAKVFLCIAGSEPWRVSHIVERCAARCIFPRVEGETVFGYASRAMWLAHICSHRADGAEHCLDLMDNVEGNLATCVAQSIAYIKLATSLLRVDVDRYVSCIASQELEAPSIRSGLFRQDTDQMERDTNSRQLLYKGVQGSTGGPALPNQALDSLLVLLLAFPRVVEFASAAAASEEDSVQLSALLADSLYDSGGLWKIFSSVRLVEERDDSVAQQPSKIVRIAMYTSLCLLRVCLVVCRGFECESNVKQRCSHFGEKHLPLILGLVLDALSAIPTHCIRGSKEQEFMLSLLPLAAKVTKSIFRRTGAYPCSEKVLFGSVSEEAAGVITQVVRMQVLLLHRIASPRHHLPRNLRSALCAVLRPSGALSRNVRGRMTQHQRQELDSILVCGRERKHTSQKMSTSATVKPMSEVLLRSPYDIMRIEAVARAQKLVYTMSLQHANDNIALERDITWRINQTEWDSALRMLHVCLYQVCLPLGTFRISFFAAVLARLCTGPRRGKLLWIQAVRVYWEAVEHTYRPRGSTSMDRTTDDGSVLCLHQKDVLDQLLLPLMRFSVSRGYREIGWTWMKRWDMAHTRSERGVEYQMLDVHARSVLGDRSALDRCLRLLQRYRSQPEEHLKVSVALHLENVLCDVAALHRDWCAALRALQGTFLDDTCGCGQTKKPLPSYVAATLLRILCKAPGNLSNSARHLREIQGDSWDVQGANGLLLLLVRQRRWQLALQHVAEMLPIVQEKPQGCDVADEHRESAVCGAGPRRVDQALFLLHGLRACANGGRAEEAAVLYDLLKQLRGVPAVTRFTEAELNGCGTNSVKGSENMFFLMCGHEDDSRSSSECGEDDRMRMIAGQARLYFFRAMTKKTLRLMKR